MKSDEVLAGLPETLRTELLACYQAICQNYCENRWEPSELNGGKFAEAVYSIVLGALEGTFPNKASKPKNMLDACRALEGHAANSSRVGDRSLRILIPRMLPVLYEIRNNRGVGHIGGDVDPNHEDAEAVQAMANWIMAELVRIFHQLPLSEAQAAVEGIVSRRHPLIWSFEGVKRVLDTSVKAREQAILLLYSEAGWLDTSILQMWIEYKNSTNFRRTVLAKLHDERLIEHDLKTGRARISPKGTKYVENNLL